MFGLHHLGLDPQVVEADEEVGHGLLGSTLDIFDPFLSFVSEEPILEVVVSILEELFEREGVGLEYCLVVLAVVPGPLFGNSRGEVQECCPDFVVVLLGVEDIVFEA